ncbi:DUF1642 domain-containing protein [Lactococcus lactis]|uniref:DUF1642 domain-containing protein n=1 Tax=Lactococcus lactis TaxID=1358 RepID=UPI0018AAD7E1|nr:DUF1642 domain-containing protein [Lactococcus lactis]
MTKEMKRPTSHISGNSIKPALSKAVEFYTDNNRQAYECIHERDEYIDYLESQLNNARPQQALPVVPECVAEWIEILKTKGLKPLKNPETYGETGFTEEKLQNIVFWISEHQEDYMRAWLDGYTVEKPQLFKLIFPNSTTVLQKNGELNSFTDTVYKRYLLDNAMTEQEIKSIDKRYWQFAVPVEDGE